MKYICGYYPKDGCFPVSMLIQQCECRGRQVFFACLGISDQKTDALMEQLFQWFRQACVDGVVMKSIRKAQKGLQKVLREETRFAPGGTTVSVSGVFCLGNQAILFRKGKGEILVAKESYGRAVLEKRTVEEAGEWVSLEEPVGIVLATPVFAESVSNLQLGQCLRMHEIRTEEQLQKQVQELSDYVAKAYPHRGVVVVKGIRG